MQAILFNIIILVDKCLHRQFYDIIDDFPRNKIRKYRIVFIHFFTCKTYHRKFEINISN